VKGDTLIFERGEHVYLVAPVAPFDPGENELDELAFAEDLKKMAPNENIGWLRGQYVEAERANENGAMWSSEELAIKSLTPMFMPVTVMHDPRSAVGLIADTKLLTRDQHHVPRARIDTTLGIWRHRFPGVWDEVASNYESGTLMQSMECLPRWYECGDCGRRYPKLPGGAEKANWCTHLRGQEDAKAVRRLGNVTFTGTGLISEPGVQGGRWTRPTLRFSRRKWPSSTSGLGGTPGRKGDARAWTPSRSSATSTTASSGMPLASRISRRRCPTSRSRPTRSPTSRSKIEDRETAKERRRAQGARRPREKVKDFEEKARATQLSSDRLGKLGKGFKGKLGEFTKTRLEEQGRQALRRRSGTPASRSSRRRPASSATRAAPPTEGRRDDLLPRGDGRARTSAWQRRATATAVDAPPRRALVVRRLSAARTSKATRNTRGI
jgi:hypothetical protein